MIEKIFKKGIGIESEKYANKFEIKKVWKQVKDKEYRILLFNCGEKFRC